MNKISPKLNSIINIIFIITTLHIILVICYGVYNTTFGYLNTPADVISADIDDSPLSYFIYFFVGFELFMSLITIQLILFAYKIKSAWFYVLYLIYHSFYPSLFLGLSFWGILKYPLSIIIHPIYSIVIFIAILILLANIIIPVHLFIKEENKKSRTKDYFYSIISLLKNKLK